MKVLSGKNGSFRRDRIPRFVSSPYSFQELLGCTLNNMFGPSKKYENLTTSLPYLSCLNPVEAQVRIGFMGDLMRLGSTQVMLTEEVRAFFDEVDYVICNIEGVLTDSSTAVKPVFMGQRLSMAVVDVLKQLKDPAKVLISCANNHAGDYGIHHFKHMLEVLAGEGFHVIGSSERPRMELPGGVNVVACTQWTNQPVSFLSFFSEVDKHFDPEATANILVMHWGYEMQLFPSPHQILIAQDLLKKWTMLIGHHSHCPQPVTSYPVGHYQKLVAYSLGNFTYRWDRQKYRYGSILKVDLGPDLYGQWQVGTCQWAHSEVFFLSGGRRRSAEIRVADLPQW